MSNNSYEFWDLGDDWDDMLIPNLGKASTARVMQALLRLNGRLHTSMIDGTDEDSDGRRPVLYRISLPLGCRDQFEELTGYHLTPPDKIQA